MAHSTTQLTTVENLKQHVLKRMRDEQKNLWNQAMEIKLDNENDPKIKNNFVQSRIAYSNIISSLETSILENIALQLEQLSPRLEDALTDLNKKLKNLENTVAILNALNVVTNLVSEIISIFN